MGVLTLTTKMSSGVNYTHTTASPSDWGSVPNETYFFDITNKVVYFKNVLGSVIGAFDGASSGKIGISDASGSYTFYTTLTLAMAAAVSGNTVELFSDIVETGSVEVVLKDGVNINGNGHTYTLSVDDSTHALTISSDGTYNLHNWNVIRTGRANGTTTGYTFYSTRTNCDVNFYGVGLENTYGTCYYGGGRIRNARGVGYLHGMYSGTAVYPYIYDSTFESKTNGFGIYALYTRVYNSTGISNSGVGISSNGEMYFCLGVSVSGSGISGQRATNCTGVSTSGTGLAIGVGRNCTGISVSGSGGSGKFYSSHLESSSGHGMGGGELYNSFAKSSGNIVAPNCSIYNSTIQSFWDNSGGHLTMTYSLGLREILNSTLIVKNASAYCITGYGGSTWKWSNNCFKGATTPVNPSFTQGITNTSDTKGNILI
jgi:hypothetical protein